MQVVLFAVSVRLFCFVHEKHYVGMVVCTYVLAELVLVCVDVMVMSSA